jgi:hypothetical protein
MEVFEHWARVREELRTARGERTLSAVGWSNESVADAEHVARRRLEAHRAAMLAGDERKPGAYPYGDGRPLQEEIVDTVRSADGSVMAVVTRNAYGALVLNCEKVLFVDLDFEGFVPQPSFLQRLFGKPQTAEGNALARATEVAARNSAWGFRVYRTKAGLRLLLHNALANAKEPFWISLLQSFGSDPMYVKLCQSQQSFRARLTPKPWRCGVARPTLRFPYASDRERNFVEHWVQRYERQSTGFAICQLLTTLGPSDQWGGIDRVVAYHDRFTLNGSQPLA